MTDKDTVEDEGFSPLVLSNRPEYGSNRVRVAGPLDLRSTDDELTHSPLAQVRLELNL